MWAVSKPVVLIGGVARIGKSRLASKVAEETGFDVAECDQLRMRFWSIADQQERSLARFRCYEEVIANRRAGLIIEGDDLISRNRADPLLATRGWRTNEPRPSLALLEHLSDRFGAKVFVAGRVDADPAAVFAMIRRSGAGTFTAAYTDDALERFISRTIDRSEQLKCMTERGPFSYLELGGDDFEAALEAATMQILSELGWPRRPMLRRLRRLGGGLQLKLTALASRKPFIRQARR